MFPVGLVSGSPVSTPIVENEAYAGFYIGWDGNRKFPLDMAGFAFSVEHYRKVMIIQLKFLMFFHLLYSCRKIAFYILVLGF